MFPRIIKYAISPGLSAIFLGLFLGLAPLFAAAKDEPSTATNGPLGSHTDIRSQFANARHLWQSGKLKEAASLYESIIKQQPELPAPYNNLAVIYAAQGDYKKAQQTLEKGLNTNPGYAMIYENLTAIYVEMARDSYGKALQFADKSDHQLKLRSLAELSLTPPEQVAKVETPPSKTVIATASPKPVAPAEPAVAAKPVTPKVAAIDTKPQPSQVQQAETKTPQKPGMANSPLLTATTSVQPAQASELTPVAPVIDKTSIIKILEAWAAAWSAQSPQQYIAYYDPQFHPAGLSRRQWEAQRVRRLKRPQWIRVALSNFVIEPITDKRVRVELQQRYQSNTYADNGRKEFILTKTEQGWRIVSERSL